MQANTGGGGKADRREDGDTCQERGKREEGEMGTQVQKEKRGNER